MNLFSKEKDLIHRIANLILVLWCVIAVFVMYDNFIDLVVKEPLLTYDEYKIDGCGKYIYEDEYDDKDYCFIQYEEYKVSTKNNRYYTKRNFINSIGNIVIVGSFIFFLNKKRNFN